MMILQAWGYAINRATKTNLRGVLEGADVTDHTDLVNTGRTVWQDMQLDRSQPEFNAQGWATLLGRQGPLGCSFDRSFAGVAYGHCVVLVGAYGDQGQVVIHDPWRGPRVFMGIGSFNAVLSKVSWPRQVGAHVLTPAGAAWAN
jgi:hypothetical protein